MAGVGLVVVVRARETVSKSKEHLLQCPSCTAGDDQSWSRRSVVGWLTLKNSPKAELYGLQGLPLTYFWLERSASSPVGDLTLVIPDLS